MRKIVFVLIVLLLVSSAALAQNDMTTFCGDLSEADCSLLTQSQEAMKSLSSAAFDLEANVIVTGVPEAQGDLTFVLTGSGAYSGTPMDMSSMSMEDMQDPAAMMAAGVEALRSVDGDLSLTLNLPEAVVAQAENVPESITLELRLVDGVGYLNAETLAPLMGNNAGQMSQMGFTGWVGLDIAGLLEAMMEQNPQMFDGMHMPGFDPSMYQQFSDPSMFAQYVTITRTDDGAGDTATFETTVDLAAMFTSPAFQEMMQQQMDMQGANLSEERIQQTMDALQAMYADSVVTSTTTIDVATGHVTSSSLHLSFDTAAMMNMAMMEATPEAGMEMTTAPTFTLDATINLSQFNEVEDITAPEDANVIPFESILGMMSSGMMGGMDGMTAPEATAEAGK
jgi:hypothetical protein